MPFKSLSMGLRVTTIVLAVIAALAAVRLLPAASRIASFADALTFVVVGWDEHTTYAPGFSEKQFGRIAVGMTEQEVMTILGAPLSRRRFAAEGETVYYYSMGEGRGESYWLRYVVFDRSETVVGVYRAFYWD